MSNGKGCQCHAHCEHECCCDADWTPKEVYDLRAENARLTADLDEKTAERDKTRRMYCIEMSRQSLDPKRYTPERCAKERGWDCFEKEAKP
jgi:hypothetical protein